MKKENRSGPETAPPDNEAVKVFRKILLRWYRRNGRTFPWRENCQPFHLLVAEMMLQRTKAEQVVPVFLNALERYPTPVDLAEAPLSELKVLLQPLGLSWRHPKFKEMAIELVNRFKGKVPESRKLLTSLPGVGDYVAGAVLSIAFNKPEWVVDANIVRLFWRYFDVKTSSEGRRDRHVIELANRYASGRRPKSATLAILDHAALVCIPRSPRCYSCPLRKGCKYYQDKVAQKASSSNKKE